MKNKKLLIFFIALTSFFVWSIPVYPQKVMGYFREGGGPSETLELAIDNETQWGAATICMDQGYWILGLPGDVCVIVGISPAGKRAWEMDTGKHPLVAAAKGRAYIADNSANFLIQAVSESTGLLLWRREIGNGRSAKIKGIAASQKTGNLYVLTSNSIELWDKTGKRLWKKYIRDYRLYYMKVDDKERIVLRIKLQLVIFDNKGKLIEDGVFPKDLKDAVLTVSVDTSSYRWATVSRKNDQKRLFIRDLRPNVKNKLKNSWKYYFHEGIAALAYNMKKKVLYVGLENGAVIALNPLSKKVRWVTSVGGKSSSYQGMDCYYGYGGDRLCSPSMGKGKRHINSAIAVGGDHILISTSQGGVFTIEDKTDSKLPIDKLATVIVNAKKTASQMPWKNRITAQWNRWYNVLYGIARILLIVFFLIGVLYKWLEDEDAIWGGALLASIMVLYFGVDGYHRIAELGLFPHYLVPLLTYGFAAALIWCMKPDFKFLIVMVIALFLPAIVVNMVAGPFAFAGIVPSIADNFGLFIDAVDLEALMLMLSVLPLLVISLFFNNKDSTVHRKYLFFVALIFLSLAGPLYVLFSLHFSLKTGAVFIVPVLFFIWVTVESGNRLMFEQKDAKTIKGNHKKRQANSRHGV